MKKHSLLKVILIVLGALVCVDAILAILGYFVKGLNGLYTMIPLGDLLLNYVQSFYYFFDTLAFLLVLGGFYAILKKVPAYNKLLDNIVQKVRDGIYSIRLLDIIALAIAIIAGEYFQSIIAGYVIFSIVNIIGYIIGKIMAREKISVLLHTALPFLVCSIVLSGVISLIVKYNFDYSIIETLVFGLRLFAVFLGLILSAISIFNLTFGLLFRIALLLTKNSNNKAFIWTIMILFAVLTSVTGLVNVLLVFVPFVVAIILLLGYDKLVAVSATIVSMLVGFMGGIYVTLRDANSYYGYSATTLEKMAGLDNYVNLWPKLVLLVLGIALLIYFVNKHINAVQDKKVKYELNESDEALVKEVDSDYKNIKTWPIIVIFALMFVIFILGYLPWNTLFGIECFDKFNEWLLGIKIGEFAVFSNVVSGNLVSFGSFASLGSYMSIVVTLFIFALLIKFIYRVKFDELLNDFVSGAKRMVPMILLVVLAYSILVDAYNHAFVSNVLTWITGLSFGKNFVGASVITALGTLLHSDFYYTTAGVLSPMLNAVEDESLFATYVLAFQSVYGLVSIIAPTSLLVIFAMKYFDIPYTTWVKYIWRFILMLFLLVILVLLVLSLI